MSVSEKFNSLRSELKSLQSQSIKIELDLQQHERVLEQITVLPNDRVCYRLVGDVLVQTDIGSAKTVLEQKRSQLKELTETFDGKIKAKEDELVKFQKDNNIQIRPISEIQKRNQ